MAVALKKHEGVNAFDLVCLSVEYTKYFCVKNHPVFYTNLCQ